MFQLRFPMDSRPLFRIHGDAADVPLPADLSDQLDLPQLEPADTSDEGSGGEDELAFGEAHAPGPPAPPSPEGVADQDSASSGESDGEASDGDVVVTRTASTPEYDGSGAPLALSCAILWNPNSEASSLLVKRRILLTACAAMAAIGTQSRV